MRTTRTTLAVASAVLCLAAASACSAPSDKNKSSSGSDSSAPIKIAVVDAQSGENSALGAWEYKGAKLAVDEWNAKGGVDGRKIQLHLFDDKGDPTTGTNIASKLASQGYTAMIGTAESGVTVAMEPTLQSARIPNITSGQSPQIIASKDPFVFLNGPTSTTYDATLAKYVIDTKGLKKVAMISNNGSYGKGEHDAFLAELKKRGLSPTTDQVVTTSQIDFSAALTTIKKTNPQVVFIGSEEVEAGLIVKQARSLGITAPFAGAAPQGTPVYISTAGGTHADGTIVSSPYLSNDANAQTKAFATAYKAAYQQTAELHGAKAYDGTSIVLTALKNSHGATGKKLADAIRATRYDGLLGDFSFDDTGVGIFATKIGVIKGGQLTAAAS
ncbi:ABC transporter substrate-binding protein [Streptomyces sp. NBC_00448]|uniref:ABC transporter substrate-binding protein n=1 Tax=Streptomyces sp. NBC_00448 TaxID=2903652 RepID=UPI002E21AD6D